MTAEQIKSLPPQWWRTRVRRYIQSPEKIIPRLTDWYLFYKDIPDPKVPGRSFFALNHKDVFEKEMTYVQKGYLSDKPRIDYYLELPTRPGQPQMWRSRRTTSPLEGFHLHLRRLTDPLAKGKSSIISVVRVGLRIFRWDTDTAVKHEFIPDLGHHELWLLDALFQSLHWLPCFRRSVTQK
jgi:hypothetical protein